MANQDYITVVEEEHEHQNNEHELLRNLLPLLKKFVSTTDLVEELSCRIQIRELLKQDRYKELLPEENEEHA
jgi:hypothetical protein